MAEILPCNPKNRRKLRRENPCLNLVSCAVIQERTIADFMFRSVTHRAISVCVRILEFAGTRANAASAGDPAVGALVFAAVNDFALLSAGDESKNDFFAAAVELGSAVPLGRRKDQPLSGENFICAGFA